MCALRDRQLSCLRFRHVSTSVCTRTEEKILTAVTMVYLLCVKKEHRPIVSEAKFDDTVTCL
jgi:hypothetical protein